ncbi:MAG TPA: hypothetical protein VNU72_06345 [Puia sp.]|jgi:hypothetical protein|nr:hypothetical protein [Puia sp.]
MKRRLLLLSTAALLFTGLGFAQTGKDTKAKTKDSTSVSKKKMPKACPGKTCEKTKG